MELSVREAGTEVSLVVWGAGAMGGCIGAALVRLGVDVLFVDKAQEHVRAMKEKGLSITGPVEEYSVPVRAVGPEEVIGTYPLIFLCVKSHHTKEAVEQLEPHLALDGAVVSIQNGLCELEIARIVGEKRTVGAFVNFGADYLEPGLIHRGNRGATVVGELDGRRTDRIEKIHGLLRMFEPNALLTENIFGFLWGKLAYAALLFATAVTDASIADVFGQPSCRPFLISLAKEVVGVGLAEGVRLEGFDGFDPSAFHPDAPTSQAEASLDKLVGFNRASAKSHSGIWRDLAVRKRATEVDAQLGWVVRAGREKGIPTPLTEALIGQIHDIESGNRAQGPKNLEELRSSR